MREIRALAEDDRGAICALDADLQAALALSRATLRALAALSPALNTAADAALEEEADRCAERAAPQRTLDIVAGARQDLQRPPAEARIVKALERALVDAANALPSAVRVA
ncbi:MAG: hypothetical protein ACXWKN_02775 [Phenylobacterium sp.]